MPKEKRRIEGGALLALPSVVLLLCLTVMPLIMLIVFSFMNRNMFAGQPWPGWTIDNFTRMIESKTYWPLLGKSLGMAAVVTLICIVAAYPSAWAIARVVKPAHRGTLMMMIILPFFTSQLLLIYAMMNLIQSGGIVTTLLEAFGLPSNSILYTNGATILVLVYEYLPYMVLCLYSSMESIDNNLIGASHMLGAGRWKTFVNIVFPMSLPGLLSGILLVFVPVAGSFVEPALVGGSDGMMVGSVINTQYKDNLNMGYGAALSLVLLIVLSVIMGAINWTARKAEQKIGGEKASV